MKRSIYGCINVDKAMQGNPAQIIAFVESFFTGIINPLQEQGKFVGARVDYQPENEKEWPERKFTSRRWESIKEHMQSVKPDRMVIHSDDGVSLVLDFFAYSPEKIPMLSISIYDDICKPDELDGIAEKFKAILLSLAETVTHYGGYITLDNMVAFSNLLSPHEKHMGWGLSLIGCEKLKEYFRGYFWGNILAKNHVDQLGGLEKVIHDAPVHSHKILKDGALFLQLTESIRNVPDENLRKLKIFLLDILLPPQEGSNLDYQYKILAGSRYRLIPIPEDRLRPCLPGGTMSPRPQPVKNQVVVETLPSFEPPDVVVRITFETKLSKDNKEYLEHLIDGWYGVAVHRGLSIGAIHFMHDYVIKDHSVKLEIDLGSAPVEVLDVLYRIIIDKCDGEGIIIKKIVQSS